MAVSAAAQGLSQGAPALFAELHGAAAVARTFSGRAGAAQPALIDGRIGLVWAPDGHPRAVLDLGVRDGRIEAIEVWSDPQVVRSLVIHLL